MSDKQEGLKDKQFSRWEFMKLMGAGTFFLGLGASGISNLGSRWVNAAPSSKATYNTITDTSTAASGSWNPSTSETLTNKTMDFMLNVFKKFSGAHYIIFKDADDANKYKALNTVTGAVTTNSTDCGALLNTLETSIVSGDVIAFASGDTYSGSTDFALTGTKQRVSFLGNGARLNFKIKLNGTATTNLGWTIIRGFYFNGSSSGIVINNAYQTDIEDCVFELCSTGISIESDNEWSEFWTIERCSFKSCTTGIKFKTPTGTGTGSYVNGRLQDCGFDAFSGTTTPYIHIDIQPGSEVNEGTWANCRFWFNIDNGTGIRVAGHTSRCSWSRFYFENYISGNTQLKAIKNEATARTTFWLDNPVFGGNPFNSKYDNAIAKGIDGISSIVREGGSPTIGLSNVYGAGLHYMTHSSLYTGMPKIYIIVGGTFSSETLSVQFQAVAITGQKSSTVTKTFTATTSGQELGIMDYDTLGNLDKNLIDYIEVRARTTRSGSTAVTCIVRTLK
jgi:hypothetical protein